MRKQIATTKKFVSDHRVAIAVIITTAVCVKLNRVALQQHNDFLKEHDLYETYYTPEEDI